MGAFVAPILINVIDSSEYWDIEGAYVNINCDANNFIVDVCCVARHIIVILFWLNNLNILCFKQYENRTTIVCFLFHNHIKVDNRGVCPD